MSKLLSANELALMQKEQDDFLDSFCTILLPGTNSNSAGGYTNTYSTVASSVPCRFMIINTAGKSKHGYAPQPDIIYVMTMPSTVSLTTQHIIVYGNNNYSVQTVNTSATWKTAIRANLQPITTKPL